MERVLPLLDALVGQTVHQVDADVIEARVECLIVGLDSIMGRVASAEGTKKAVVEALHADAQAVYAAIEIRRELAVAEVAGISLKSNLGVRFEIECGANGAP